MSCDFQASWTLLHGLTENSGIHNRARLGHFKKVVQGAHSTS